MTPLAIAHQGGGLFAFSFLLSYQKRKKKRKSSSVLTSLRLVVVIFFTHLSFCGLEFMLIPCSYFFPRTNQERKKKAKKNKDEKKEKYKRKG